MQTNPRVIELYEFKQRELTREELPVEAAELLRQKYQDKIRVEATSFLPNSNWKLTSQGFVGYLPLTLDLGVRLRPKVSIDNIFRMLEYAYELDIFHLPDELADCSSLEDFYNRLAKLLAVQVLNRARKGFYRAYQQRFDKLPYVRGRLDLRQTCQRPWDALPACHFEEHTPDVEENRILAWTLLQVLRSGLCTNRSLPLVRQAYRRLAGFAEPGPCEARACIGRLYNRLNQDYQPMHALCRFFLEHRGPGHESGDYEIMPFLVKMDRLYELFVARWLVEHIPEGLSVETQEEVRLDEHGMAFQIDLVVYDAMRRAVCVMDTKYKIDGPSSSDIQQVVAYAESKGCRDAILIYPANSRASQETLVGDIRVRYATFSLDGDLDEAGRKFLEALEIGT